MTNIEYREEINRIDRLLNIDRRAIRRIQRDIEIHPEYKTLKDRRPLSILGIEDHIKELEARKTELVMLKYSLF